MIKPVFFRSGWAAIALIYLYGVCAVASLAKMVPLRLDLANHVAAGPTSYSLIISLIAVPAAACAGIGGAFVDRWGPKRMLVMSAMLGAGADLSYILSTSETAFLITRFLEGFVQVGIFTSGAALLIATTEGPRRVTAMSIWSTATPVGISTGLTMAGAFAGTEEWRWTFAVHGAALAALALAGLGLPGTSRDDVPPARLADRLSDLLSTYRQIGPLRLGLTFAFVINIGLGMSSVMPSHLSRVMGIPIGSAARYLALANFSMIAGAFCTAALLRRGVSPRHVLAVFAALGTAAGFVLFVAHSALAVTLICLCLYLLVAGGATALLQSSLPKVARPGRGAAAAGLLSQIGSIATFLAPPIWLATQTANQTWLFVGIIGASWVAALGLLPQPSE